MISPLEGARVVDFTHGLAGPLCGYQLGLLGAEVVKVERPDGGDSFRERGLVFDAVNAGKRSLVLDITHHDAREKVRDLVRSADIVVHNFRPSVAARIGLTPAEVLEEKPRIILCTVTGYGLRGDWADRPAIEWTAQAATGLMSAYVDIADRGQHGVLMLDPFTGMMAAQSILAGWIEKERTGTGVHVDVSLLDAAMIAQSGVVPGAAAGERRRTATERPGVGRFATGDGHVYIGAVTPLWQRRTFDVLGLDADDIATPGREVAAEFVRVRIERAARDWTAGQLAEALTGAGVPAAAVDTLVDVLRDDHPLRAHVSLEEGWDRNGDPIRLIGSAVRFNGRSLAPRSAAPALGEYDAVFDDRAQVSSMKGNDHR